MGQTTCDEYLRKARYRFLQKVQTGQDGDCWRWLACKDRNGYPRFRWRYRVCSARQVAVLIFLERDVPESFVASSSCKNRWCVNPKHIILSHKSDLHRGPHHYAAKVPLEGVRLIREHYGKKYSRKQLAEMFNVHPRTIQKIARRERWKEV